MLRVLLNPASGNNIETWDKTKKYLESHHIPYDLKYFEKEYRPELYEGIEDGRIIVIGGDGTLNRVVNEVKDLSSIKIGFIPAGSGNDYAHAMGISKNIEENFDKIFDDSMRTVDVGQVTYIKDNGASFTRRFNISCGIGFDAAICALVAKSKWKRRLNKIHLGNLIYLAIGIKLIVLLEKSTMKITFDGQSQVIRNALFAVGMNTCYEGGGIKFCPDAQPFDQELSNCTVGDYKRLRLFGLIPKVFNGSHITADKIVSKSFKEMEIETEEPLWVHQDGEIIEKSNHIKISVSDQKLQLLN